MRRILMTLNLMRLKMLRVGGIYIRLSGVQEFTCTARFAGLRLWMQRFDFGQPRQERVPKALRKWMHE